MNDSLTNQLEDLENELNPDPWDIARQVFPRIPFPWGVLPEGFGDGFQQLGRAHATWDACIPGAAFCVLASAVGGTVTVSPKAGWNEPLVFWCADVRPSGTGKTSAPRALCHVLYEAQTISDRDHREATEAEQAKPKDERQAVPRARSFFANDLTIEGLRRDLADGHGGIVIVYDELSAFVGAQNQYKKRGSDRESWLALHDGNPARVIRGKESFTITSARPSIFGGIQPAVWRRIFSGADGLYMSDGTVFRFLPVFGGDSFFELTGECWSQLSRERWEGVVAAAITWADGRVASGADEALPIILTGPAQSRFFEWRNDLFLHSQDIPDPIRGFLPKLAGYAVRLAGVLHLFRVFASGGDLEEHHHIDIDGIERGITAAMFYGGQIVDAMQALVGDSAPLAVDITEEIRHLADTIESLEPEVENGRLAVGYIADNFNQRLEDTAKFPDRRIGAMLREVGLNIPATRSRANGRVGAFCLVWDERVEKFLEHVHKLQHIHKSSNSAGLDR